MTVKINFLILLFPLFLYTSLNGQLIDELINEADSRFAEMKVNLEEDNPDSVIILCEAFIQNSTAPQDLGLAYYFKGQAETVAFRNSSALASFQEAKILFEKAQFKKGIVLSNYKIANVYFFMGSYSEADPLYDIVINQATDEKMNGVIADVFQKKATIYGAAQNSNAAISSLKNALKHAKAENAQFQMKDIMNELSTNFHSEGILDSAIFYYQQVLDLKLDINDKDGLISDYSALGNLYRERGNYDLAQQNLINALRIAETELDTFSIITIYSEIGDIYAAQNIRNNAEKYYRDALLLAQLKSNRFAEAGCYKKLGELFYQQGQKEIAVQQYEAALAIYESLNSKINTAEVLVRLSSIYTEGDQFEKAKKLLLEALKTRKTSKDLMSTLSIKMALAKIEIDQGNNQKGIQYIDECLPLFEDMNDLASKREAYELLSTAYNKSGNYKKAFQTQQLFQIINDSLLSIEQTKAIKKYDMLYNTEKKDKEIAQQNEMIKTQEVEILRKNNQVLLLAGGLSLLGLFAALLFFIYRKNKQLNLQRIEVLKKEKERQSLVSVIEGEEKERKRFSRELHDGLGAVLGTVKMYISGIGHKLPQVNAMETYQKAEQLIDDACRTVREISHDLMPYVLEQQGLEFAIRDMCQNHASHYKIEFEFIPFGKIDELNDTLKITLYRITQELLKNIIKHAAAKEVIVQLSIEENEAILIVEDDGKGFDTSTAKNGIGLENIRSRVSYLNGELDIDSTPDQGSTFTIQLSLNHDKTT